MERIEVILFDGYCNLCSGAVQFILKHEKSTVLKFSSLQSGIGKRLLEQYKVDPATTDSIVYINTKKAFIKSDAAIKIAAHLKFPWSVIASTGFMPKPIRDFFYDVVARNRYRVFGKKDECWLPKPEWKERFLS